MWLKSFYKDLEESQIIDKDGYQYFVNGVADGVPFIKPHVLRNIADSIVLYQFYEQLAGCDYIVTVEAMGIPIATLISDRTGIPLVVIRKRKYGLPGEFKVKQVTGYSKNELFINTLKPKDKIFLIDDVISTGGTMTEILNTLQTMEVNVSDVLCLISKGDGINRVKEETGFNIKCLAEIEIHDKKVRLKRDGNGSINKQRQV